MQFLSIINLQACQLTQPLKLDPFWPDGCLSRLARPKPQQPKTASSRFRYADQRVLTSQSNVLLKTMLGRRPSAQTKQSYTCLAEP